MVKTLFFIMKHKLLNVVLSIMNGRQVLSHDVKKVKRIRMKTRGIEKQMVSQAQVSSYIRQRANSYSSHSENERIHPSFVTLNHYLTIQIIMHRNIWPYRGQPCICSIFKIIKVNPLPVCMCSLFKTHLRNSSKISDIIHHPHYSYKHFTTTFSTTHQQLVRRLINSWYGRHMSWQWRSMNLLPKSFRSW